MYYLTQTVYSMAGYRTLQDIVSGYFAHRHWYCGEDRDDDLRSWPLAERWKDERDSCYVSAISMRSWYSLIGHGVGIRISNDKRLYQERGIFAVPSDLRRLFRGVPNRIEVDGHYKLISDADFIALDLALAIDKSRQGGRIIRIDIDNGATRLKTNPLLAEDERFALLTRRSMDYLPPAAGPELLKMQLQHALGSVWQSVSPAARRFLISRLVYYEECDAMGRMLLDASPGIISLTKALELEVNQRLLRPFRQWLSTRGVTATTNGPLKPFASAVASPSGTIELGRMGFALRSMTANNGASAQSISQEFTAFCRNRMADPYFVLDELPETLLLVARRYRNPAAHIAPMEFSRFRDLLELLLVPGDYGTGLLQRIFVATEEPSGLGVQQPHRLDHQPHRMTRRQPLPHIRRRAGLDRHGLPVGALAGSS